MLPSSSDVPPPIPGPTPGPKSIKSLLNDHGLRFTPQRRIILSHFQALPPGEHLRADDVHQYLKDQGERISLSTVYRTLHVMANLGLLRELELSEGSKYYELNHPYIKQHHHLVCIDCGSVLEFEDESIAQIGRQQARSEGFHLLDSQLTIYAVCAECRNQVN